MAGRDYSITSRQCEIQGTSIHHHVSYWYGRMTVLGGRPRLTIIQPRGGGGGLPSRYTTLHLYSGKKGVIFHGFKIPWNEDKIRRFLHGWLASDVGGRKGELVIWWPSGSKDRLQRVIDRWNSRLYTRTSLTRVHLAWTSFFSFCKYLNINLHVTLSWSSHPTVMTYKSSLAYFWEGALAVYSTQK